MRLKDVAVGLFAKLATDKELLDLLEVPITMVNGEEERTMRHIKEQIIEDKYPNDLVVTNLSRMCVYELPSIRGYKTILENSFIEIDIYVSKDRNVFDRRTLLIANRIYDVLNGATIDGFTIIYYNRLPNLPTNDSDWSKYGMVFSYNSIIL